MQMTKEQSLKILNEAVRAFGRQEWFRDAAVYNSHPDTGDATLEIKVNYIPLFERKKVLEFAAAYNLTERFVIVDKDGKPVE